MTDRGRIEGRLPDLLAELAPARVPDYFDDLCRAVERTPQRPAWRSPERWFPMGTMARTAPLGLPSWRPLIALALLLLALVVGTVLAAGAFQQRPAPPFGLAANGPIVFATADGDILVADPATGRTTDLVVGDTIDTAPWFSRDGSRLFFVRTGDQGDALMVASADGSGVRELVPAGELGDDVETSPTGDRVVVSSNHPDTQVVKVVAVADGSVTSLEINASAGPARWRPGHEQLVLAGGCYDVCSGLWLVDADGSESRRLPTLGSIVNSPALSPDGRYVVYTTWDPDEAGGAGLIHVLDIDSGEDRELLRDPDIGRFAAEVSPDGSRILIERYDASDTYRVAIMPIDGGQETLLGEPHPKQTDGAAVAWSPDGTRVLATYRDDGSTWLLAADGSNAEPVTWPATEMTSWRRLAP